jgi:hypothetical protein
MIAPPHFMNNAGSPPRDHSTRMRVSGDVARVSG